MNKINILHIYQNSKIGGIQQQILSILKEYDREVFNPVFCCLGPRLEIGEEMEKLGIDVVALNRQRYSRFSPGIIYDLFKLMKDKKIRILRTHKYRSNFYGRPAAWLAGVPVIISSEHNIYIDKEFRYGRRIVNHLLSRITDKMIAVSDAIGNDIVKYDWIEPSKVQVIRNGVDTEKFSGVKETDLLRKELLLNRGEIVLGFTGRLVVNKGLKYLIDAAVLLKEQMVNFKILIIGKGSLFDELKEMAKSKDVLDKIVFAGERRDIPALLSCFDVYVLPSIKEGLPNALLEAMAAGKPIVATTVGGIPEIIEHGINGLLVPPGDAGSLAKAIKKLIDDSRQAGKLGLAARQSVLNNHSIKATARTWQTLYLSLLKEKGISYPGCSAGKTTI